MKRGLLALILVFLFPIISLASVLETEDAMKINEEIKEAKYQQVVSFDVNAIFDDEIELLGCTVPIMVHYNNSYDNVDKNGIVTIDSIGLSNDGILSLSLSAKDIQGIIGINQNYKYTLSDGTVVEGNIPILTLEWRQSDIKYSDTMLRSSDIFKDFKSGNVVSVEVWITEYIPKNK